MSSTPQLPQLPLLGEAMYESMWMYGWEMLLGVWGVVRVCFAGPVAWFGTLHLCVAFLPIWIPSLGG